MTSPIGPPNPTSDLYNDVYQRGSRFGQDLTPEKVKALLTGKGRTPFVEAADKLSGFKDRIFGDVASAISGNYSGDSAELAQVSDGQLAINNRLDLIDPMLNYYSAFAPLTDRGHALFGTGPIAFNQQIGPSRGVSLTKTFSSLEYPTFDSAGLWEIDLHIVASWVNSLSPTDMQVRLSVIQQKDGYAAYSEQVAIEKTRECTTFVIRSSVVIPEPGYRVRVDVRSASGTRGWLGGPKWSRLTLRQMSTDSANFVGNEPSSPDPGSS